MTRPPSRPRPAAGTAAPVSAVPAVGGNPARLAAQLTGAERMLGAGEAGPAALARAALTVQLACLRLATHPGWATVVTGRRRHRRHRRPGGTDAATAQASPFAIVAAEKPTVLRADYQAAQAATGVRWSYLAAINFVETDSAGWRRGVRRGRVRAGGLMHADRRRAGSSRGAASGARRHQVIGDHAGGRRERGQQRNAPVRPAALPKPQGC